jgi:hypothetical protein
VKKNSKKKEEEKNVSEKSIIIKERDKYTRGKECKRRGMEKKQ